MRINPRIKSKQAKGFTLIELMITVAIVGILAAVALPAYQDYTIRAQMSEGLILAEGAKTNVLEFQANNGGFPSDGAAAGFSGASGKYVESVAIADGVVSSTFGSGANSKISGKVVSLTPTEDATSGNLIWKCASDADAKYIPTSCK